MISVLSSSISRCDTKNAKMRFTGHAAGLWAYKNKKRSNWCLWPPMKTGDTAKVGACISGLLGGSKSAPVKVNGNWTTWTKSGTCSKVCGSGKQNFTRICSNPTPANGGNACQGLPSKSETCNPQPCAVHGNWTVWSKSGVCSKACGADGKQNYTRTCSNPTPAHSGNNCTGPTEKSESCNTSIMCPVNGNWTVWSKSGVCSKSCGATESRTTPEPAQIQHRLTAVPTVQERQKNQSPATPVSRVPSTGYGLLGVRVVFVPRVVRAIATGNRTSPEAALTRDRLTAVTIVQGCQLKLLLATRFHVKSNVLWLEKPSPM